MEEEGFRFRSVTYRLYPNSTQEAALKRSLDLCHELYNRLLGWSLDHYRRTGEKLPRFDLNRVMTRISASEPGMRSDVYSTCRQNVTGRVHRAMAGCRPGRTGVLIHVPRFKSSNRYHSFCYESRMVSGSRATACTCPRSATSATATATAPRGRRPGHVR